MSTDPTAQSIEGVVAPVANDAWYLNSQGRRFGPLGEDEMRGYFRAGMVKVGDTIEVQGQVGSVPAETAATVLGMTPPVARSVASAAMRSTFSAPPPAHSGSWVTRIGAVVAIIGLLYFTLHKPLQPRSQTVVVGVASAAPTAPMKPASVVTPAQVVGAPEPSVSVAMPAQTQDRAPGINASEAITAATMSSSAAIGARVRSAEADEWYERATILALAEDWSGMLAHASAWTVAQPTRDVAWWYLGTANMQLGSLGEAETSFKRALAISPMYFNARWSLAAVYLKTNRTADARPILQELVRERPGEPGVWNDLGVAMDNSGEFDEAVAAYTKSVELQPDFRLG